MMTLTLTDESSDGPAAGAQSVADAQKERDIPITESSSIIFSPSFEHQPATKLFSVGALVKFTVSVSDCSREKKREQKLPI